MLCKSDKPSIIIIITSASDEYTPHQYWSANFIPVLIYYATTPPPNTLVFWLCLVPALQAVGVMGIYLLNTDVGVAIML